MRDLDKPIVIKNKKYWVHHTIPGNYLPLEKDGKFSLVCGGVMVYFSSKQEATSKGWKESDKERRV